MKEITKNRQKCEIYAEMQWNFGIQAILDTCDTKYYVGTHLTLFGTSWPQELPVEHIVALINDKNIWEE